MDVKVDIVKTLKSSGMRKALENRDFNNVKDFVCEMIEDDNIDFAFSYVHPYI